MKQKPEMEESYHFMFRFFVAFSISSSSSYFANEKRDKNIGFVMSAENYAA